MRIKDSPKNNADGTSKKENKKKNNKQKTEANGSVTGTKNEKSTSGGKTDKEGQKPSTKDQAEQQVTPKDMTSRTRKTFRLRRI